MACAGLEKGHPSYLQTLRFQNMLLNADVTLKKVERGITCHLMCSLYWLSKRGSGAGVYRIWRSSRQRVVWFIMKRIACAGFQGITYIFQILSGLRMRSINYWLWIICLILPIDLPLLCISQVWEHYMQVQNMTVHSTTWRYNIRLSTSDSNGVQRECLGWNCNHVQESSKGRCSV